MAISHTVSDLGRLVVAVSESTLMQELNDEAVLLNLETGEYFGLNGVGARAWQLFQQYSRMDQVLPNMLSTYEVPEDMLRADLRTFLADLEAHGLVTVHDSAA